MIQVTGQVKTKLSIKMVNFLVKVLNLSKLLPAAKF